jgi:chemotaxis protein methyltransferase WspC
MTVSHLHALLKQAMGLDVVSVGPTVIERAVQERQRVCGTPTLAAYVDLVRHSESELQALIETVVVPETWFFRDPEAFAAAAGPAAEAWRHANTAGPFRLLSLPCSTGEEPYSMAMALLDGGWAADRFTIDAIDISGRVLDHARRAEYRRNSFRGANLAFRDRYFTAHGGVYRLSDAVRQQVHFRQANVFAPTFPGDLQTYDAIFCRNMLIYFDRQGQAQVVDVLRRLLAPQGFLFVGPSETGTILASGFATARLPMAFAFRHREAGPGTRTVPPAAPARRAAVSPRRLSPPPPSITRAPLVPAPSQRLDADLVEARQLADQGHFVEAARLCEEHLRRGPDAEAFYLLGLVRDASGNHAEAVVQYRKALYLQPAHGEALAHLALLLEHQGQSAEARLLRDRLTRLQAPPRA